MHYKKNYNIKVVTLTSDILKKSLDDNSENIYTTKTISENCFKFTSNSSRVGSDFVWKGRTSKYFIEEEGFLINQSLGKNNSVLFIELMQEPKHLDNFNMFFERYFKYLVPVSDKKPITSFENYSHILLKRKENRVITSKQNEFEAEDYDEIFAAVDGIKPFYENLNNYVELPYKELLHLNNGFYRFYPKKTQEQNKFSITPHFIQINSETLIELSSKYKVNYNSMNLYKFISYPSNYTEISLNDVYSPLIYKQNLESDNEYIIYKLENNSYIPQYILTKEGENIDENFNLLINSHPEFLRPYFILPLKTEISLSYKNNKQITEKLTLINPTFKDKKENLSGKVPHINITSLNLDLIYE